MRSQALIPLMAVAVVLIVFGRLNHRRRLGTWIALAGYAVLAITIVVGLVVRG